MGGKVTGVGSAAIDNVEQQRAKLRKDALNRVIDYYSAPDGEAGDAQRAEADKLAREAWGNEQRLAKQAEGMEDLRTDAIEWKNDFSRWLRIID